MHTLKLDIFQNTFHVVVINLKTKKVKSVQQSAEYATSY